MFQDILVLKPGEGDDTVSNNMSFETGVAGITEAFVDIVVNINSTRIINKTVLIVTSEHFLSFPEVKAHPNIVNQPFGARVPIPYSIVKSQLDYILELSRQYQHFLFVINGYIKIDPYLVKKIQPTYLIAESENFTQNDLFIQIIESWKKASPNDFKYIPEMEKMKNDIIYTSTNKTSLESIMNNYWLVCNATFHIKGGQMKTNFKYGLSGNYSHFGGLFSERNELPNKIIEPFYIQGVPDINISVGGVNYLHTICSDTVSNVFDVSTIISNDTPIIIQGDTMSPSYFSSLFLSQFNIIYDAALSSIDAGDNNNSQYKIDQFALCHFPSRIFLAFEKAKQTTTDVDLYKTGVITIENFHNKTLIFADTEIDTVNRQVGGVYEFKEAVKHSDTSQTHCIITLTRVVQATFNSATQSKMNFSKERAYPCKNIQYSHFIMPEHA